MSSDGMKIASYVSYLRRRATGWISAGEVAYYNEAEKDVIEIINSLCDIKPHPDTGRLDKLENQKFAGESWTLLKRPGGGIPYPVADSSRPEAIRYPTARVAIDALKEDE